MNIVATTATTEELSGTTALPQITDMAVLALIAGLHRATRELDALRAKDGERFHLILEATNSISTIADELATALGLSIEDAWAPVLAEEAAAGSR